MTGRVRNTSIQAILAVALFLCLSSAASAQERSTLFYTVGHQDDWQLFMNPNAYHDARVVENTKVVFIYMTAGDAGYGRYPLEGRRTPYYQAREDGAFRAAQFVATRENQFSAATRRWRYRLNDHWIYRVEHANTVSYFLRLPDGNPWGTGYEFTGYQSLERLYTNRVSTMTDVRNWTTYEGWGDLVETLKAIVAHEARGSTNVWANVPEPDAENGLGHDSDNEDHSDHRHSGIAMLQAVRDFPCVNTARFLGYQTRHVPIHLSEQQKQHESATWGATISGLLETDGAYNTFNDSHNVFLGKNVFTRTVGTGPCSF